jgi:hypothetical protein
MERLKQTTYRLENDVAELKEFKTKIQGSLQAKTDVHYCTSSQEFGEYALDEIDTFRFAVDGWVDQNKIFQARYCLLNPTPELSAYLKVQGKVFSTECIPVDTEHFEEYCMKKGGTPFVLTDEIRKCLDSKLWEFVGDSNTQRVSDNFTKMCKNTRREFYTDVPITFENTYTISPHVSFYITPLSNTLDKCVIHEITTKQVVFRIKYGNTKDSTNSMDKGLKLHYSINGIVKQNDTLLD